MKFLLLIVINGLFILSLAYKPVNKQKSLSFLAIEDKIGNYEPQQKYFIDLEKLADDEILIISKHQTLEKHKPLFEAYNLTVFNTEKTFLVNSSENLKMKNNIKSPNNQYTMEEIQFNSLKNDTLNENSSVNTNNNPDVYIIKSVNSDAKNEIKSDIAKNHQNQLVNITIDVSTVNLSCQNITEVKDFLENKISNNSAIDITQLFYNNSLDFKYNSEVMILLLNKNDSLTNETIPFIEKNKILSTLKSNKDVKNAIRNENFHKIENNYKNSEILTNLSFKNDSLTEKLLRNESFTSETINKVENFNQNSENQTNLLLNIIKDDVHEKINDENNKNDKLNETKNLHKFESSDKNIENQTDSTLRNTNDSSTRIVISSDSERNIKIINKAQNFHELVNFNENKENQTNQTSMNLIKGFTEKLQINESVKNVEINKNHDPNLLKVNNKPPNKKNEDLKEQLHNQFDVTNYQNLKNNDNKIVKNINENEILLKSSTKLNQKLLKIDNNNSLNAIEPRKNHENLKTDESIEKGKNTNLILINEDLKNRNDSNLMKKFELNRNDTSFIPSIKLEKKPNSQEKMKIIEKTEELIKKDNSDSKYKIQQNLSQIPQSTNLNKLNELNNIQINHSTLLNSEVKINYEDNKDKIQSLNYENKKNPQNIISESLNPVHLNSQNKLLNNDADFFNNLENFDTVIGSKNLNDNENLNSVKQEEASFSKKENSNLFDQIPKNQNEEKSEVFPHSSLTIPLKNDSNLLTEKFNHRNIEKDININETLNDTDFPDLFNDIMSLPDNLSSESQTLKESENLKKSNIIKVNADQSFQSLNNAKSSKIPNSDSPTENITNSSFKQNINSVDSSNDSLAEPLHPGLFSSNITLDSTKNLSNNDTIDYSESPKIVERLKSLIINEKPIKINSNSQEMVLQPKDGNFMEVAKMSIPTSFGKNQGCFLIFFINYLLIRGLSL